MILKIYVKTNRIHFQSISPITEGNMTTYLIQILFGATLLTIPPADEIMKTINIVPNDILGKWNYTIKPKKNL